jgi:hypothetical protein
MTALTDFVARYTAKGRRYNAAVRGVHYRTEHGGFGKLFPQDEDERAEIVAGLVALDVEVREKGETR